MSLNFVVDRQQLHILVHRCLNRASIYSFPLILFKSVMRMAIYGITPIPLRFDWQDRQAQREELVENARGLPWFRTLCDDPQV